MRRVRAALPLVAVAAAVAACATAPAPRPNAGWRFPARYRATQVVTVGLPGGARELVASVLRDGPRVEVTLFEPALLVPLVSASGRRGAADEVRHAPGIPAGLGRRLVELLSSLHELEFDGAAGGAASAGGVAWRLEGLAPGAGCAFPRLVELDAPGAPAVRVETTEVTCDGPAPPASAR